MELYLIQHAEAFTESENPQRPLNPKGISDIRRVAVFLKEARVTVSTIFHSTKRRAQQTARILADTLNSAANVLSKDDLAPDGSPDIMLREIIGRNTNLMIVGHLPYLSRLASKLLTGTEAKPLVRFIQGSVLSLSNAEGQWEIKWFITPEILSEIENAEALKNA